MDMHELVSDLVRDRLELLDDVIPERPESIVIPLTRDECRRLYEWAAKQEREPSQAIRFMLREVLAESSPPPLLPDWEQPEWVQTAPCPDCGRKFRVRGGITLHRRKTHGVRWEDR